MKKKIKSVVSIPDAQFANLKDIFTSHAEARSGGDSKDGSLMKWDSSQSRMLMNQPRFIVRL